MNFIIVIFELLRMSLLGIQKGIFYKPNGKKLAARVLKTWVEDFVDEDTGEVVSIDRNELVLDRDHILVEEDIETIIASEAPYVTVHREDKKNWI